MKQKLVLLAGAALLALAPAACNTRHEVELKPVEVKPIHITIDVNVRVDRALDDFFSDLDQAAAEAKKPTSLGDEPAGGGQTN